MAASTPTAAAPAPVPSLLRRLVDLDAALSLRIHTAFLRFPRAVLKALEISGDGRFWFPITLALLPLSSPTSAPLLLSLLLGLLLDLLFVGLLKFLVRRPRPVYNKGMSLAFAVDHWSFPSGHSSRVFLIAALLSLSAASLEPLLSSRWIGAYYEGEPVGLLLVLVLVWAAATALSRVLLGRHFVLDVIAGACLGVFEAVIVLYFFDAQLLYDYIPEKWFLFS